MVNFDLVHERTLMGAVDSFLGQLVHVRPHLAGAYRDHLETMVEQWLTAGYANQLEAVTGDWLQHYLRSAAQAEPDQRPDRAVRDFYQWAVRQQLLEHSPVG